MHRLCALCTKPAETIWNGAPFCRFCATSVFSAARMIDTGQRIGTGVVMPERVPDQMPDALDVRLWTYIEDARRAEA